MRISKGYQKRGRIAFTLLEVMIAIAIFFGCTFAILALVSRSLQAGRSLQAVHMDASSAIAMLSLTNRLEEGPIPPEIIAAFEAENPNYTITGEIVEVATNGLFRATFVVGGASGGYRKGPVTMTASVLLFRPMSQSSRLGIRR